MSYRFTVVISDIQFFFGTRGKNWVQALPCLQSQRIVSKTFFLLPDGPFFLIWFLSDDRLLKSATHFSKSRSPMPISKPQQLEAGSSSSDIDIELPVLISHARSFQPPPQIRASSSSPISEKNPENNSTANPTVVVDEIEPPTPAYFPPSNHIPPASSSDAGLLEYTRIHGHSEIPLTPRQREDDRTSVQASEVQADALPAYGVDSPPVYSRRPTHHDLQEPSTWPMLCFKLGFGMFSFTKLNEKSSTFIPLSSCLRQSFPFSGFAGLLHWLHLEAQDLEYPCPGFEISHRLLNLGVTMTSRRRQIRKRIWNAYVLQK